MSRSENKRAVPKSEFGVELADPNLKQVGVLPPKWSKKLPLYSPPGGGEFGNSGILVNLGGVEINSHSVTQFMKQPAAG